MSFPEYLGQPCHASSHATVATPSLRSSTAAWHDKPCVATSGMSQPRMDGHRTHELPLSRLVHLSSFSLLKGVVQLLRRPRRMGHVTTRLSLIFAATHSAIMSFPAASTNNPQSTLPHWRRVTRDAKISADRVTASQNFCDFLKRTAELTQALYDCSNEVNKTLSAGHKQSSWLNPFGKSKSSSTAQKGFDLERFDYLYHVRVPSRKKKKKGQHLPDPLPRSSTHLAVSPTTWLAIRNWIASEPLFGVLDPQVSESALDAQTASQLISEYGDQCVAVEGRQSETGKDTLRSKLSELRSSCETLALHFQVRQVPILHPGAPVTNVDAVMSGYAQELEVSSATKEKAWPKSQWKDAEIYKLFEKYISST